MILKGQNLRSISFFDEKGRLSSEETAFYFRENPDSSNLYKSFYSKNKSKYFEGVILNASDSLDNKNLFKGLCKWYYPNGNLKSQIEFNEIGVLNGAKKNYYESGKLKNYTVYENGKNITKEYFEYDTLGNISKVFDENFADNSLNWPIISESKKTSRIRISGLELMNSSISDFAVFSKIKIDSLKFGMEAIINSSYLSGDCKAGLIFGFKDWNNYQYFLVSKSRIFVGSVSDGLRVNDVENFYPSNMKIINTNTLNVEYLNDSCYYFVNGELQFGSHKKSLSGLLNGLYTENGISFFDNFKIIQYSRNHKLKLTQTLLTYKEISAPLRHIYAGLLVSQKGYIISSIKNPNYTNGIKVELKVNDSIKEYYADIVYKDDFFEYTLLKLGNPDSIIFPQINYKCSQLTSIDFEKINLFINYYKVSNLSYNIEVMSTDLNTNNRSIKRFSEVLIGSPIFNESGDLLGFFNGLDGNSKIKLINVHPVIDGLFHYNKKIDIKKTLEINMSQFNKEILKNIVIVKTF